MPKSLKYLVMLLVLFAGCESVYEAELDEVESALAVDARLIYGKPPYQIILQKSAGFNEADSFEPFTNALVQLLDSRGEGYLTQQVQPGVYELTGSIDSTERYKLHIIAEGETFSSDYESVPETPDIDNFYSEELERWSQPGGETNVEEFKKTLGHQVYADISNGNKKTYYRFDARKVFQYTFPFDTVINGLPATRMKYGWESFYPDGNFNIAAPPEYATDFKITNHPLEFFQYSNSGILDSISAQRGWIYIIYQHAISQSAWNFYKDLNSQLGADGKIFDPLYVQARSNLKCTSNSKKIILGNFEISRRREHRVYIYLNPHSGNHTLRRINDLYDIPERGVKSLYPPVFWQN